MSTIRTVIFRHQPKANGNCALAIRIIQKRKPFYVSLGKDIPPNQWDDLRGRVKPGHRNAKFLNHFISRKFELVEAAVIQADTENEPITHSDVADIIKGKPIANFYEYALKIAERFNNERQERVYRHKKSKINKLKEFDPALTFTTLTTTKLQHYEQHLKNNGNNTNTVGSNMAFIKAIVNQAIREKVVKPETSPFLNYKIRSEKSSKTPLTRNEIEAIRKVQPRPGSWQFHAQNTFLFSFNNFGMRFGDICMLRWEMINEDRLIYRTGKSGKPFNILLTEESKKILEKYSPKKEGYIFPFIKGNKSKYKEIDSAAKMIRNPGLLSLKKKAGITKKVTPHIARHSVAQILLESGVGMNEIQAVLAHDSQQTTKTYVHGFGTPRMDEINKIVTGTG